MEFIRRQLEHPSALIPAIVCLGTLTIIYRYYANYYTYWIRRSMKGDRPFYVFGELYQLFTTDRVRAISEKTKEYGKIWGTFMMGRPCLVIADPEVVRQICIKDFDAFPNHRVNTFANKYQRNFLVWLQDEHWKQVRALMSPSFTSGKIKRMFKLLDGCSDDLMDNFKEQYIEARRDGKDAAQVDLLRTYSYYTMDSITTSCYGLKLKRQRGDIDTTPASTRNSLIKDCNMLVKFNLIRVLLAALLPKTLLKAVKYNNTPESDFRPLVKRVERIIEKRRSSHGDERSRYDDLLQMIVEAKLDDKLELNEMDQAENHHAGGATRDSLLRDQENLKSSLAPGPGADQDSSHQLKTQKVSLSDIEVISESAFLLVAGLDTTRSSLSAITFFLSHNQEVQERLHQELRKIAKFDETAMGKRLTFDYDELTSCQYLDAVISESLRMIGPAPFTDRIAKRDYKIEKYDILIRKGDFVLIGLHSIHNDPDYWEEPDRFNPDRFMPGQREKIMPGSYAPFSMGPRHCIGMRFSLTETKLGLAKVVLNFKFDPAPGTKYPPESAMGNGIVTIKNCTATVSLRDLDW